MLKMVSRHSESSQNRACTPICIKDFSDPQAREGVTGVWDPTGRSSSQITNIGFKMYLNAKRKMYSL